MLDQGRQALPFLRSFAKSGYHTTVICNTRLSESFFSRYPDKRLLWPSYMEDREGYERKLFEYLEAYRPDVTISVGDITSDILSKYKVKISKYTNITSPDYPVFLHAADKLNLMQYCMKHNLPCPRTYDLTNDTLKEIRKLLEFPVIVKPNRGLGAIGVERYDTFDELVNGYKKLKAAHGNLIVQEYIPQEGGMQYQAEAFVDMNGKVKVCMVILKPRFFPVNGGTSTANVTIRHAEIEKTTRELLEGLHWRGAADVDYILDPRDNNAKILEINPRVTAGIKIGFAAGIDYADLHVSLALGNEVPEISDYKLGIYCRNFFLEILWFVFSNRKMKRTTTPRFFRLYGGKVVDQIFSWHDPMAGIGFFLHMVKKYLNVNNLKAKFHR
jgi:D-aspartate ligase